ncbi:MAG: hypothetical protein ABJP34_05735 [Erythrobacter sp.]
MFKWLRKKVADSPSLVVLDKDTKKTVDLECPFKAGDAYHGKLKQDRWNDGQERFSIRLHDLPPGSDPVKIYRGYTLVAEFEREGPKLDIRQKGMADDKIPEFRIGERLQIEVGGLKCDGIVRPD